MDEYAALFQFLNLPDAALETALGTLHFPNTDAEFFNFGVFLPAMLPLWSTGGPSYVGYWKHWFSPRRLTVVQADIEENLLAREIARDFSQLVCVAVQAALSAEGSLSSEVRALMARTELSEQELDQIVQIAEVTDEENGLFALAAFTGDPPLACFPEDGQGYPGDFPHEAMTLTLQNVCHLCTYETSTRLSQQIAALPFAPPWFTETNQSVVFDDLLQQGDYEGAWLSLNSTGWKVADAKAAPRRLASKVRSLVLICWWRLGQPSLTRCKAPTKAQGTYQETRTKIPEWAKPVYGKRTGFRPRHADGHPVRPQERQYRRLTKVRLIGMKVCRNNWFSRLPANRPLVLTLTLPAPVPEWNEGFSVPKPRRR